MWPAAFWEKVYEPVIRRAAGLGTRERGARPRSLRKGDRLLRRSGRRRRPRRPCRGARRGTRRRARDPLRRGFPPRRPPAVGTARNRCDARPPAGSRASMRSSDPCPNVRIMQRTTVFGVYDGGIYGALERVGDHLPLPAALSAAPAALADRRPAHDLATGAIERPLVFGGNDKPGVMLASARAHLCQPLRAAPGRKIAFFITSRRRLAHRAGPADGRRRHRDRSSMRARMSPRP